MGTDETGRQVMKQAGDGVVEERRRAVASRKQGELWKLGEERIKRGQYERRCALRSLSRCDVVREGGSRTVDGPPEQQGTETPWHAPLGRC